ncbi:MAG: serine/threonine-protein kinase [Bacteroidota bacterium]
MSDDPTRVQDPLVGVRVGEYHIERVIGRGGMGVVYKAEDTALGIPVALKAISAAMASDATFVRRFRTEARAMARVASPHIVRVMALRETEHGLFIVMEYVDGGDLHERMAGGPMPWERMWPLLRQMLLGLEAAHTVGVIHRDIKPRNVLLTTDDTVKLTDFGLARFSDSDATRTQAVAGTLAYMSPEQVRALPSLDHRSDLFSLGLVAYEALAGRLPFDRDGGDFTTMRAIVEEAFPSPTEFHSEVPASVAHALMRALERDPDRRYQTAEEMRDALAVAGDDLTPTLTKVPAYPAGAGAAGVAAKTTPAEAVPTAASGASGSRLSPALLGIGALALAAVVAVAVWLMRPDPEAEEPARTGSDVEDVDPVLIAEGSSPDSIAMPPAGDAPAGQPQAQPQAQLPGQPIAQQPLPQPVQQPVQQPPPPRTQQPRPAAPAVGTVAGVAPAGVTLSVNGSSITNGSQALAPGTYTARCEAGPLSETSTVTVSPGQTTTVQCYTPARAVRVTVTSTDPTTPWMSVVVNGSVQAQTPTEISLPVGRHTVFVRRRGYEVLNDQMVTVDVPPRFTSAPLPPVPVSYQVRAQ